MPYFDKKLVVSAADKLCKPVTQKYLFNHLDAILVGVEGYETQLLNKIFDLLGSGIP